MRRLRVARRRMSCRSDMWRVGGRRCSGFSGFEAICGAEAAKRHWERRGKRQSGGQIFPFGRNFSLCRRVFPRARTIHKPTQPFFV